MVRGARGCGWPVPLCCVHGLSLSPRLLHPGLVGFPALLFPNTPCRAQADEQILFSPRTRSRTSAQFFSSPTTTGSNNTTRIIIELEEKITASFSLAGSLAAGVRPPHAHVLAAAQTRRRQSPLALDYPPAPLSHPCTALVCTQCKPAAHVSICHLLDSPHDALPTPPLT